MTGWMAAASPPALSVAGGDLLVDGRQQGAGAAGEVADLQPADGLGVSPVHALHLGDGQAGQQGGGGGQGVEGGQVLAVGDQPLENAAGEVVSVVDAGAVDAGGGLAEAAQHTQGDVRWQLLQYVLADGKDGPVVDLQDGGPGIQRAVLGVGDRVAADEVQGLDALRACRRCARGRPWRWR